MKREDIFEVIYHERDYQDSLWPRDRHPLLEQYRFSAPHLLLLEDYIAQAREKWRRSKEELDVVQTIAKIAAIAVRALEEIRVPEFDLLKKGLR